MAILKKILLVLLLLTSSPAVAGEYFAILDETGGLDLGDAVFGLRFNHYDIFHQRQPRIDPEKFIESFFGQLDTRVGLLPAEYSGWIANLELKIAAAAGGEVFNNTPLLAFGLGATFKPLADSQLHLQTSIKVTPMGMDHNATIVMLGFSNEAFDNKLRWLAGASFGYQPGGSASFLWAMYGGVSWQPVAGLWFTFEYGGQFRDGAFTLAIGYTIANRVQLYLAAPTNYNLELTSIDMPAPAMGVVIHL